MDKDSTTQSIQVTQDPRFSREVAKKVVLMIIVFVIVLLSIALAAFYLRNKSSSDSEKTITNVKLNPPVIIEAPKEILPQGKVLSPQVVIKCPSLPSFCEAANIKESSISAKLGKGAPVYAAFDGTAQRFYAQHPFSFNEHEKFSMILLENKDQGVQAIYNFKGNIQLDKGEVKQNELLANIDGSPITFMQNNTLVVEFQRLSESGWARYNTKNAQIR